MKFGFLTDQDATRFCYLRLRRLKEAIKDAKVLAAIFRELEVPGDPSGLSARASMAAIERRIEQLRGTKTSLWYEVPAPEILAASIFRTRELWDGTVQALFNDVLRGEALVPPVITWVKGSGLTTLTDVPFETGQVDVVGYRQGFLSGARVVAIEIKNDLTQLESALEQVVGLSKYTHATYLACTPALAARYLVARAADPKVGRWEPDALHRRLHASGCGLLLVEGAALSQALLPNERHLDGAIINDLAAAIRALEAGSAPGR